MYAGESGAGLYPPMQFEWECNNRLCVAFGPKVDAVYPEYLTDFAVAFCPSDAADKLEDHMDAQGRPTLTIKVAGNRQEGVEAIDASYTYFSYLFDQCDVDDAATPAADISTLAASLGVEFPEDVTEVPLQFEQTWRDLFETAIPLAQSGDAQGLEEAADTDRAVAPGAGNGGGSSATVYRLREGIERFLITDVNNPGASAVAQSGIFIMLDNLSTEVARFNHVPGGSNVLFMDGHVEFVRYPGPAPVNRPIAAVVHLFDVRPSL
jgi:prepilin-type processing-associated H-X9-DG protein